MTVREALHEGHRRLRAAAAEARVETPLLDASVLLAEALQASREQVFARMPDPVDSEVLTRYEALLARRGSGLPVSYILGRKEFYGRTFLVGPGVLVPRPETEALVETALSLAPPRGRLHDTCTGSGAVAVTVAAERPDLDVSGSDRSQDVVPYFRDNCRRILDRQLRLVLSDLLESITGLFDVISANPPYLTDRAVEAMKSAGWPEPETALAAGPDGLAVISRLVELAPARLVPNGFLVMEADPDQTGRIAAGLDRTGFRQVSVRKDLSGRDRIIAGRWPG